MTLAPIIGAVLILGILLFGMVIGGLAQLVLGRHGGRTDWTLALIAGLGGSFVGGLISSLIAGDGLAFRPSGIIGSIVGALIITAAWRSLHHPTQPAAAARSSRSGRHRT